MGAGPSTTVSQQLGNMTNQTQDRAGMTANNAAVQNIATNGSPLVQSQLQQNTNNGIKNASGVVASTKGINPAMAAREAGYNAANAQQQSANSAAQTQGQIQLGAQNQLSSNLNNQYNQDTSTMNQQNTLNQENNQFNANQSLGIAKGFMSAIGGGMMGGMAEGGLVKMAGGGLPGMGGGSSPMLGGASSTDSRQGDTTSIDNLVGQPAIQAQQAQDPYSMVSSFFSGLSANGSKGANSQAGQMLNSSSGGSSKPNLMQAMFGGDTMTDDPQASPTPDDAQMIANPQSSPTPDDVGSVLGFFRGGAAKKKIPAMVSPGEVYLKPGQAKQVAKGKANPIKAGEKIPGKPKVSGNSYTNDVVPKKLDAGGVVIPNSVMQSSDPAHNAYKFVQAVMAQKKAKGK